MSNTFEYPIAYEDRDAIRTSRWQLNDIKTLAAGPTNDGWLWFSLAKVGDTATITVFSDDAGSSSIASGTGDISDVETTPVKITLTEESSSGVTGELYVEAYTADADAIPLLVSLCIDKHVSIHYAKLTELPAFDATFGMAEHCSAASSIVLLLVSNLYNVQLGGFGAPEDRNLSPADRLVPDFRKIVTPQQLRAAAVHKTLELAFFRSHDMAADTMYSENGDRHKELYDEAVGAWNLTIAAAPDDTLDAGESASASFKFITRN